MAFEYAADTAGFDMSTMLVPMIVGLVFSVFGIVCMVRIFMKAGYPGWHAIIPILNSYDEFEMAQGNGLRFLLLLIPIVNIYIMIKFFIDFAKAFGKSGAFGIGLIFFGPIFLAILAFGDAEYVGP